MKQAVATAPRVHRPLRRPTPPSSYSGFDGQYINGSWRPGKQGAKEIDTDPYSGETLAQTNGRLSGSDEISALLKL